MLTSLLLLISFFPFFGKFRRSGNASPFAKAMIEVTFPHPITPDGRYFVVNGRLWRCSNPMLSAEAKAILVSTLMRARSAKGEAIRTGDAVGREIARQRIDQAKHELGERGEVWWSDGAKDWNRHLAKNSPYAEWFGGLSV